MTGLVFIIIKGQRGVFNAVCSKFENLLIRERIKDLENKPLLRTGSTMKLSASVFLSDPNKYES